MDYLIIHKSGFEDGVEYAAIVLMVHKAKLSDIDV
jgi:hypothetical protein